MGSSPRSLKDVMYGLLVLISACGRNGLLKSNMAMDELVTVELDMIAESKMIIDELVILLKTAKCW
jgi:hypothetical protein